MNIVPLQDRVVLKRIAAETKSPGGIIYPENAKEKPVEGEVLAVGEGKIYEDGNTRPLTVKVGDRVLFGKYAGTEVKLEGIECLILREEDILAVVAK